MCVKWPTIRSAMCESGRYDSFRSSGVTCRIWSSDPHVQTMFACVSIAPFGGPVVPDV